jgi:hypothetical protein
VQNRIDGNMIQASRLKHVSKSKSKTERNKKIQEKPNNKNKKDPKKGKKLDLGCGTETTVNEGYADVPIKSKAHANGFSRR